MAVRLKRSSTNGLGQPEWNPERTWDMEVAVDNEGYSYAFGHNEVKNFMDDGRGLSVEANSTSDNIAQDAIPYGDSRS